MDDLRRDLAGRYTLEREIGRGGMADVFLATDVRNRRPVAVKVLRREVAQAIGRERFEREIHTASLLRHPHILPLFDSGEAGGLLYYVMPLIEGESLRARLSREVQLPVADAVRIAQEIAGALAYAHERGIVHRDVKPENILLEGGHALLADFGVASAIGGEVRRLTDSGIAVGTPAYMSPEQGAGERVLDGRSDIYALGCVVFEMLVGEPPFTGPTVQAIVARRFEGVIPKIITVRPATPPAVEAAVTRALALVPADRWTTAAEFAAGLEGKAAPPERPLLRPIPWALLGAITLALALGWWGRRGGTVTAPRLAVLPFDNLGPADQQYFADGVSDEVRGKLTLVPGLTVIARASSVQYRGAAKPPGQIGRELGATYLLTGTVRWEKHPDGTSLVHVSPELIRVADGAAQWEQSFDASLTDVFTVQTGIATQVAQALDIALAAPAQRLLAARPTENLAAYDAYLQGEEASDRLGAVDPSSMRQAIGFYAQAVRLDSTFALAWARLGAAHALHYTYNNADSSEGGAALAAARRAAALAPALPEAHIALGTCETLITADQLAALGEYERAAALLPSPSAEVWNGRALAEQFLGRWTDAVADLRKALGVDPRSALTYVRLTRALLWLRRYPEAVAVGDSAKSIAPGNLILIIHRAMILLAQGDLAGARRVLRDVPPSVDRDRLVAQMAQAWGLHWVLDDDDQRRLLATTPAAFDDDRGEWGLTHAEVWALRGDLRASRAFADSARSAIERQAGGVPADAFNLMTHALALAYAGRASEAVREGERAVARPEVQDQFAGLDAQFQLARIYLMAGDPDRAVDRLSHLLQVPFFASPAWLRLDPDFARLRGNPRYERLTHG